MQSSGAFPRSQLKQRYVFCKCGCGGACERGGSFPCGQLSTTFLSAQEKLLMILISY